MRRKIPVAEPDIGSEELRNVMAAVKSGWVSSGGPFVKEFEEGFAEYVGPKYGVSTSSGTAALHLALRALDIGRGDEVLVPTLTFAAVANAVLYVGARPVFVDSRPDYWCMDPAEAKEKITKRTKAVIAVHLYGHPCDLDPLTKVARDYYVHVIEDCAEAHGAEYKGRKVGSFGSVACFSFYGNKLITTGEGGMCLTEDESLAERMKILRDHGMRPEKKYWHEVIGFNYRMTNLQAALGVAQLAKLDAFIRRKREISETYRSFLNDVRGVILPPEMSWAKSVFWYYSILVDEKKFGMNRDELMLTLHQNGVETRRFFYPIHSMPPYRRYASSGDYKVAERLSSCGMSLPSGTRLKDKDIRKVSILVSSTQR